MKTSPKESRSTVFGRLYLVVVTISLVLIWAGCASLPDGGKPETVSLAEAKKITAHFEGDTFDPPPRPKFGSYIRRKLVRLLLTLEIRSRSA